MKKGLLAILITIPIIFSGCTSSQEKYIGKEEDFNKVLGDINKCAEEMSKRNPTIDEKYKNWMSKEEDFNKEECEELFKYSNNINNGEFTSSEENKYISSKIISFEQAKEDIDMLFEIFRNCYAAYGYFGGDDTFLKAKKEILRELQAKDQIQAWEIEKLIYSKLDFLKDAHFNSKISDSESTQYYAYKDVDFFKDKSGYYKLVNDKPYYINQINNEKDINKFMKYTINKDGKLVYTIALMDGVGIEGRKYLQGINAEIEYLSGKSKSEEKIKLSAVNGFSQHSKQISYSVKDGVPVAKLGRLYSISPEDTSQEDFGDTCKEMRNYPVGIIDLRGTGGGYVTAAAKWIKSYSGEDARSKSATLMLNGNFRKFVYEKNYNKKRDGDLFQIETDYNGEYNRIKNRNIIFLLVDRMDRSASEMFIEYMREMDNVVLVGTNTSGTTLSIGIYNYTLKILR